MRRSQRLIELPMGVDIVGYLRHDGKPPTRHAAPALPHPTLAAFRDQYLETHQESLEERTTSNHPASVTWS